jgi:hypothetical protein
MSNEFVDWGSFLDQSKDAFAPIPIGTYQMIVDDAAATKSSTGKTMFKVKYKVVGGASDGKTCFNNITISPDNPKALYMFFENMAAMGIPRTVFASSPPPSPDAIAGMLHHKMCTVELDHQLYNGMPRENIKSLRPAGGAGGIPGMPAPSAGPAPISIPSAPSAPVPVPPAAPAAPPAAPTPPPMPPPVAPTIESTVNIPAPSAPVPPDPAPPVAPVVEPVVAPPVAPSEATAPPAIAAPAPVGGTPPPSQPF